MAQLPNPLFAQQPIAVFDSGIGGLSVLDRLVADFPHQDFVYFGDTAQMPYGSKNAETLHQLVHDRFNILIRQFNPKALVIACNTATTVYEQDDWSFSVPVIGLIRPLIDHLSLFETDKLGVLATPATVNSGVYQHRLTEAFPQFGQNPSHDQLRFFAAETLAWLIEQGFTDSQAMDRYLTDLLQPVIDWGANTLVLGCTHYPLIQDRIQHTLGPDIRLIDPAVCLRPALNTLLADSEYKTEDRQGQVLYTVSGPPKPFETIARQFTLNHLNVSNVSALALTV